MLQGSLFADRLISAVLTHTPFPEPNFRLINGARIVIELLNDIYNGFSCFLANPRVIINHTRNRRVRNLGYSSNVPDGDILFLFAQKSPLIRFTVNIQYFSNPVNTEISVDSLPFGTGKLTNWEKLQESDSCLMWRTWLTGFTLSTGRLCSAGHHFCLQV